MTRIEREEFNKQFIICECGYHNPKENIKKYGACKGCKKVLDEKAKYKYEMFCKLKMWRKI